MQVTDPCRKRPMRGREGLVVGKGIWWWGLPRKGSENCREEGAAGRGGQILTGHRDGRRRGKKTVVEHQHSRKFEFTLVGRWDVKREEGSGDHRNHRKSPLATKPPDFNFCLWT